MNIFLAEIERLEYGPLIPEQNDGHDVLNKVLEIDCPDEDRMKRDEIVWKDS